MLRAFTRTFAGVCLGFLATASFAQSTPGAFSCALSGQGTDDARPVAGMLAEAAMHRDAGRMASALELAQEAQALADQHQDHVAKAWSAIVKGSVYLFSDKLDDARNELEYARKAGADLGCARIITWADLYRFAAAGQQGDVEVAMTGLEEVLAAAVRIGDAEASAVANYQLGLLYKSQFKFDEALAYFDSALVDAGMEQTWVRATSLTAAGTIMGMRGRYPEATGRFREALDAWSAIGNCAGEADVHHYLGNVSFQLGNYREALDHYLNALTDRQETGPSIKVGESFHDIGHIYFKQEHYPEALEYYTSALARFRDAGNNLRVGQAYGSMGNVYNRMGDTAGALKAYETSISILGEIGDPALPILVYALNNVGELYVDNCHYALARERLMAARKIALALDDPESLSLSYYNLAAASFGLERWEAASALLDSLFEVTRRTGSKDLLMWGHYLSARVDSALGKPMAALDHYKAYKLYSDSLQAAERDILHAEMKARFESEQKEDEIRRLEAERELQQIKLHRQATTKNLLLAVLVLGSLLAFFTYRYYVTRQRLRIQVLRNRIAADLHDEVGSTLSSIAIFSEIAQQRSGEVKPMLQTINESARKMLEAMTDIVWTIHPDNDQFEQIVLRMRNYAYELLGAKGIGFDFSTDDDMADIRLPMDLRRNLFLIFKEATNNLLKYAEADMAVFRISTCQGGLSMVIRDNGRGFDPKSVTAGNGLKNMRRRAEEVGGTLVIDSAPGRGTTVQFSVAHY